ncbi:MAG: toll/interleukin-1 receptor domain-containing protein [Betaproteobacteria bacterium]|nr:toll/interleukin-1 receptor domain-containing protein [Betaproteobacteria bacterium]
MMAFRTHVFISYSHGDNVDPSGQGWVSRFHELLEGYLTSRLKRTKAMIWRDKRLSDNEVFDPVIREKLPESAVLVAVLSDNYIASPWCREEALVFCDAAEGGIGLAPDNKSRVFKVVKLPPEKLDGLPPQMCRSLSTDFFVRVDKNAKESGDELDKPVPLDPSFGPEFAAKLNLRVSLLAADIASTLKVLEGSAPVGPDAQKPVVYLAECGEDRRADREVIRSELQSRQYTVLPDHEMPNTELEYRADAQQMLERCALSIHLLGAAPGFVPDGEGEDSVVAIQNEVAVARARSGQLCRVISLPNGTVSRRPRHQMFLEAVHVDAEVQYGADLITADLQAVKMAIRSALQRIEQPPPIPAAVLPDSVPDGSPGAEMPTIYVIFHKEDMKASAALRKALAANCRVLKPVFAEETAGEMRRVNEAWLAACDVVMVYYGSGSEAWKASVDCDLLKAPALRSGRPFRAVFTWLADPGNDDKEDLLETGGAAVIDGRGGVSSRVLGPVFDALGVSHDG